MSKETGLHDMDLRTVQGSVDRLDWNPNETGLASLVAMGKCLNATADAGGVEVTVEWGKKQRANPRCRFALFYRFR